MWIALDGRDSKVAVGRELTKDKSRLKLERESVSALTSEASSAKNLKKKLPSATQDSSTWRDLAHVEALIPC